MDRRNFIKSSAIAASTIGLTGFSFQNAGIIATNVYPWMTFYRREGKDWNKNLTSGIARVARSGINGFEPMGESPEQIKNLIPLVNDYNLKMHSLYVNSVLHEPEEAQQSIEKVLAIAEAAKENAGTQIIVTNPSPISWSGTANKSDAQLMEQAKNLDKLGKNLRESGMTLAYHNHDAELRKGAREFHHMLTATDPENVKFCLDAHWVYRGCGNSEVALFDIVRLYVDRIVELHLRQSRDGIWTEVFTIQGDINYRRLFNVLHEAGIQPHMVLEQSVEEGSPNNLTALEAHRKSYKNLKSAL